MKTAQSIPRIGLARAKGEHLAAANDQPKPTTPPAQVKRWKDKSWKYTPAVETDIRKTIARAKREQKGRK